MDFNNTEDIKSNGFTGFKTISDLWNDHTCIPDAKGVYLVLTPPQMSPVFLAKGSGGFFKNKDPNKDISILKNEWVDKTQVIYIGKATSLRKRLNQYLRFGQGKNIGHYGGRYIWQLENHADLIFCWQITDDNPGDVEKELIKRFRKQFNDCRPFANLAG